MQRAQPPVVDRVDTRGEWRAETAWPIPGSSKHTLWLAPDGRLEREAPAQPATETLDYRATVGALAGGLWSGGLPFGTAGDQRPDDAWSLVCRSEPLEAELAIVGRPTVVLHAASTASVAAFSVRLEDIAPDGARELIAKGVLNATRRLSTWEPEAIEPGEPLELTIEIDATAWTFEPGHRIGLAIASADFPNLWPTPEPAQNTVFLGGDCASRLVLPVVPNAGGASAPTFEPSPTAVAPLAMAVTPPTWRHVIDVLSGREHVQVADRRAWRAGPDTVVERDYEAVMTADPADPAHASAHGRHDMRITRANVTIQAIADATITSTATDFHAIFDLIVTVNGRPHAQRRWVQTVPRDLL